MEESLSNTLPTCTLEQFKKMIPQNFLNAVKIVSGEFRKNGINWVLVGSSSLALQGVDIVPNDIDVLTSKEDALKCNSILKEFLVKPVEWSKTERYDSYFGEFRIEGVKVEIMGGLKVKKGDDWIDLIHRLEKPRQILNGKMQIPVSPLEDQLESYKNEMIHS